jgi:Immunoglobulin I-set domain
MTLMNKLHSAVSFLALTALLACGGGGGSTPPPPTTVAPTISTQPTAQSVMAGSTATFTVTAAGTAPLSYQWNKGGTALAGGTLASYTTPVTAVVDSGSSYTVTVSNSAGSITSSAAVLTVQPLTATTLAYTDPTTGTYLLKKNTALSTATHLVLDLVGPAATTGTGVTATFSADATKVTWANVAAGDPVALVQTGGTFNLGTAPQILKGKVTGNVLQVTAAQKGTASPVSLNAPLLRIALDLKATQPTGPVTFTADAAKCQVLDGTATIATITVSVGTLTAQ